MCVFAKQDVTRDPPFSNMDLISCRNLLIYLGPALQSRVLPIFHYALNERGLPSPGRRGDGVHAPRVLPSSTPRTRSSPASPLAMPRLLDFARPGPHVRRARRSAVRGRRSATQLDDPEGGRASGARRVRASRRRRHRRPGHRPVSRRHGRVPPSRPPASRPSICSGWCARTCASSCGKRSTRRARRASPRAGGSSLGRGPIELGVLPFTATTLQQPLYAIVFDELPRVRSRGRRARGRRRRAPAARRDRADPRVLAIGHRAARGGKRGAQGRQRGDRLEQRGAAEHQRGARDGQGGAAGGQRGARDHQQEMVDRNREATRLNDDLANVLDERQRPHRHPGSGRKDPPLHARGEQGAPLHRRPTWAVRWPTSSRPSKGWTSWRSSPRCSSTSRPSSAAWPTRSGRWYSLVGAALHDGRQPRRRSRDRLARRRRAHEEGRAGGHLGARRLREHAAGHALGGGGADPDDRRGRPHRLREPRCAPGVRLCTGRAARSTARFARARAARAPRTPRTARRSAPTRRRARWAAAAWSSSADARTAASSPWRWRSLP